ncbi:MAG: cupin-like domain-containing protein [Gammaproteobacteria bacterium]|nr:cupin-like domain-containing protein [Gammaproteobacteria bacterium]
MPWHTDLASVASARCPDGVVPPHVFASDEPVRLEGLVADWPAVRSCKAGLDPARRYLSRFFSSAPLTVYVGDAAIHGRFFYNDDCSGFNFRSGKATLTQVFERLAEPEREPGLATIYVGSTPIDQWLPGFRADNDVRLPAEDALASFWLGNRTRISAHYDFPDNLACVIAGERRVTLFPPDQIGNLYVGPVDRTPSGQAISMVDLAKPDLERFPKFAEAARHARTAWLTPGDALFIPSMWWHHIEAMAPFNLLVNYWWCTSPAEMGSPSDALLHAMLALRDLPERQREAWRGLFDHYVFEADEEVHAHIPEAGKGYLAALDEAMARRLRADLRNRLNR